MKRSLLTFLIFFAGAFLAYAPPLSLSLNNLPTASSLTGSESFVVVQSGLGKKASTSLVSGVFQPLDADLTTYAGISPSANVQTFLGGADYAALRTQLGLVIGTNVQAFDSDLSLYAAITPAANTQTFLGAANYAAMRTQLALTIGTNVQAFDADLTTYAGITPAANVQTFLGAATYAAMRTQLGLVIGTDVLAPTGAGGSLTLVATGFNGNLATTDDTVQEVAQKFDDLVIGGGGNVSNSGTPVTGQAAEWTTATVIQGVATTGTGSYVKGTLPTLTILDNAFTIQDNGDPTKQMQFMAGGITTGTTRTYTMPDVSDTLVTLTSTGTLTNKTLTSPVLTTPTINGAVAWQDGTRQTFNPNGTASGLNAGSQAGDPSTPTNGDIWYDSTANTLDARINGATVNLGAGGGAPSTATYITQTADGTLSAEQALGALATGVLKNTTTSGVLSIAVAGTDYVAPARTLAVAGTANEITSSAGTQDLSADRTWTLSLPATIDLGAKTSFEIPNAAAPVVDAFGELAGDNNLWAASRGAALFFDGTAATALVGVVASDAPSNGHVPTWKTGGFIEWEPVTATAPGADTQVIFNDGGVLGADTGMVYNKTTDVFTVPTISVTTLNANAFKVLDTNQTHGLSFVVNGDWTADKTFTYTGEFTFAMTLTANTNITFPTSGTLSTLAGTETLSGKTLTAPRFADLGFIADANGNEFIILDTLASAVNEVTLRNAATANNPGWTASGGDTNIGIDWTSKGTGAFRLTGNATQAATLQLFEITGSGTNFASFAVPPLAANTVYTLPPDDGDAGEQLQTDGAGVLTWEAAGGGAGAPTGATYITQTADGTLTAEQALSSLSTGIMRVATTTGVVTSLTDSAGVRANLSDEVGTGPAMFTRTGVLREVYVNAGAMISRSTAGAATATVELATNDIMFDSFDFDSTASEGVGFWWTPPNAYNDGTVTIRFHWTAASGTGTVTWSCSARALPDDAAMDQALGTAVAVTDTLIAVNDMHLTSATGAITIAGTPAGSNPIYFQITRDVADTLGADARLLGCTLEYTESATEPGPQ